MNTVTEAFVALVMLACAPVVLVGLLLFGFVLALAEAAGRIVKHVLR